MAGREPIAAHARLYNTHTGVDNQLIGLLDFGDGLMAHFDCAMNQKDRQQALLAGTLGYLEIPNSFNIGTVETQIIEQIGAGNVKAHYFEGANMYTLMAEDFMHSFTGKPPVFPIEDSLGNMRTIQALFASARLNGQPIAL